MKNITIVGGGSAGFMVAATLLKQLPNSKITLIESKNVPTVGVGESTITGVKHWTKLLDIKDKDFLKATDGIYKLSIKFTDFYKKGESFHYPFGRPVLENNKALLNDWWFKKILNPHTPNSDYAESFYPVMAMINNKTLDKNADLPFIFDFDTAYHFDATKFAHWLKNEYCIPKGLNYIQEDIVSYQVDENGIKSLNNKHTADLFIDCTGFKALLLGEALGVPFESYNDLLPNDSAIATKLEYTDKSNQMVPYTNCTAIENGWVWNIPLWSRIGTGYVYSSNYINEDQALEQFENHLKKKVKDIKKIKIKTGIHKKLWVKNVCAIGLSAGFIEPLESNGLHTVIKFLLNFLRNVQREKISQWDKDNYTYQCKHEFKSFAEFVALHYALSHRTDTQYWKDLFNKNWTVSFEDLKHVSYAGLFRAMERRHIDYHFSNEGGMHCIAAGMNWSPTDYPALSFYNQEDKEDMKKNWTGLINDLNLRKKEWNEKANKLKSYMQFMKDEIYGNIY
tara:strand:- start:2637 stop:4160 length:1524 start_codon:yes stop_codon:yes gene_type:complete